LCGKQRKIRDERRKLKDDYSKAACTLVLRYNMDQIVEKDLEHEAMGEELCSCHRRESRIKDEIQLIDKEIELGGPLPYT